ncbi:substrate-binding periplasmic protein [Pseudoduganella namucuonensis]|uniref:Extracellular solute-binding protein, family 3 n=1 Tax=Pseudoduganella namucuonensis TaxID=1035707 RepID=A0A1I7LE73_9BURK|nr:transporter substrate-binding domain-containing protein [Pseudoduganella namucuonensis]SFV08003.1 extracellular solute-binding protein, family 3 [Pseudoduganella namucuonensis]
MMKNKKWLCTLLASVGVFSSAIAEEVTLGRNQGLADQWVAAKLITDIGNKAGVTVKVKPLPAARANELNLSGEIDGEIARIDAYAAKNPTLVQSKPLYYYLVSTAFGKKDKSVSSIADLKQYRVGIIRGVAHAMTVTAGMKVTEVNGPEQLFLMLDEGKIDIAVSSEIDGNYRLKKMKLGDIKPLATLAKFDQGAIFNPAKRQTADKLAKTTAAMKQSGELDKLTAQYEKEFLSTGVEP